MQEARKISEIFCEDMNVPYCEIYYVDRLFERGHLGLYIPISPHIFILENAENKSTLLLHELIHHLDAYRYTDWDENNLTHSSKGYISAKRYVVIWCKKNISNRINWNKMLKCTLNEEELKNFKL